MNDQQHDDERPQASYLPQVDEDEAPRGPVTAAPDEEDERHDTATGELPPRRALPPPPPEQEVLPRGYDRAADQQIIQTVAHTGGSFVDMLEDGRLSQDLHGALAQVQHALTLEAERSGKKAKGQIVLTIDLDKEGEMYSARAKFKVKVPEPPRPKSVMWDDGAGNFTRFPPNQTQMFGTRQVRNVP